MRGRRRSASISTTRSPLEANATARFAAVEVLPSPADGDVTRSVFTVEPAVASMNRTAVRSDR
jgi:hypothetical protein